MFPFANLSSLARAASDPLAAPPHLPTLTRLVLLHELNDLVNQLDRRAALALRLAHNLGVASLVGLDWWVSGAVGDARTGGDLQWMRSIMMVSVRVWGCFGARRGRLSACARV